MLLFCTNLLIFAGGVDDQIHMKAVNITELTTVVQCHIEILDDIVTNPCEEDERFFIVLESLSNGCNISNSRIPVTIKDDGKPELDILEGPF